MFSSLWPKRAYGPMIKIIARDSNKTIPKNNGDVPLLYCVWMIIAVIILTNFFNTLRSSHLDPVT